MFALITASLVAAAIAVPVHTSEGCIGTSAWTDCASVNNTGSQIDVGASMNIPGPPTGGGNQGPSNPGADNGAQPGAPGAGDGGATSEEDCGLCRPRYSAEMAEEEDLPEVTISDLASFVPARPTLTGEPDGFAVVGMPANLVASASEQQIAGELFDWDVVVRFTPAGFTFDHGDGTSARSGSGGASWSHLGQAQFTPTATSHVYGERGTYPVSVTVQYTAAVDFGLGWQVVPGYVSASAGGYDVQVLEARTALVEKTCLENRGGPGC